MNWILLVPTLALVVAIYAVAAVIGSRRGYRHGMKAFEAEHRKLQVDHGIAVAKADRLEYERNEARKQRDELNRENESLHTANKRIVTEQLELHKQNTKLREDLTETQAENALWLRAISTLSIEDIENLLLGQLTPMLRERIVRTREHQTVEIEEVKPESVTLESPPDVPFLTPALRELEKPKRPPRKPKVEKN